MLIEEAIEVERSALDMADAIRVIEDYKPLDVQSAAMCLALCRGIRARSDEIMMTIGAQHALYLIARLFIGPDTRVGFLLGPPFFPLRVGSGDA